MPLQSALYVLGKALACSEVSKECNMDCLRQLAR